MQTRTKNFLSLTLILTAALTVTLIFCPLNAVAATAAPITAQEQSGTGSNLSAEVIRLHILADSDKKEAQDIKLLVRDSLLPYLNELTVSAATKEEALTSLSEHCDDLEKIAEETLRREKADYSVTATVTSCYFPIRIYGSQTYLSKDAVIFPPGVYDTVQVVLGTGDSYNWWCLAYPSLCFIDASYDYVPKESREYLNTFSKMPKSKLHQLFHSDFSKDSEEVDIVVKSRLLEVLKELFTSY